MELTSRRVVKILFIGLVFYSSFPTFLSHIVPQTSQLNPTVNASAQYIPQAGNLVVGSDATVDNSNVGSWRGALGSDDNYWTVNRVASSPSLNLSMEFNGVETMGANKMIITVEDSNVTTATVYLHQICDWNSAAGVDNASDAVCNGSGGWRTLQPRKSTYNTTADTSRVYEVYDGYFWNTSVSPGTVLSTPLTNFIRADGKKVIVRTLSTVSSTVQYRLDAMQVEMAIDPAYEPAGYVKTQAGTTTGNISDLIGAGSSNGVSGSDGSKLTVPMSGNSSAIDNYFVFKNIKTFSGADTILVEPEICVSNVALTFTVYLYNFQTTTWTQVGSTITGTACTTDTDYAFSFNSASIAGFSISDYISSGEVRFRILTAAPAATYNMQLDRIYLMIGAVNANSTACEISWGTGTATDCANTRKIYEGKTVTPTVSTWQATAALEYPTDYYSLDNDDDAVNSEYATSQNLSFPVTLASNMSVTAIHYGVKYRSNSTAQTADLQIKDYTGINGTSGWVNTPGTDANTLTTYSWFDTWNLAEYQGSAKDNVDTIDNTMNLRLRTSAGSTTNPGTRDWAFAMMSIRWVEETNRITLLSRFTPTGGALITGSTVATDLANTGSWRGTLGNDSATNGSGNYWTVARANPGGMDKQLYFDGVQLYGANKIIVTIEDSNITTADAYVEQICDWNSTTGVDNVADSQCTGGGWRTLNERGATFTSTSDTTRTFEIYDGYFSSRSSSPGTAYATPLTNFIRSSDKRVLIRTYSTVASTTQHRTEAVFLEVAIDPVYEPVSYNPIAPFSGSLSGYISSLVGTGASEGTKFIVNNTATNPMDFYYSFKNIQTYPGMNTILVKPEICVSTTALTFNVWLYNFTTSAWVQINTSTVTGTACTTDTGYAFAKSDISIADYVSNGEVRVRFNTAALNTNTFQMDRIYLILGSTVTDTDTCEISWGAGTATNCTGTKNISDAETGSTANTPTWQTTSALEYPNGYFPLDNDDDTTNAEAAFAASLSFPVSATSGMSVTAIHYAGRFRTNATTLTNTLALKDFSAKNATSGWVNVGVTNALATFTWTDSYVSAELQNLPYAYLDTYNNRINMKLRTSVSTNTAAGTVRDWDFAMVSIRWANVPTGTLYADIVDSTSNSVASPYISFGAATTSLGCQTSTATFGTTSQKIRIYNNSANPQWTLSLSANNGASAVWSAGTPSYDFNDPSGTPSGCGDGMDADSLIGDLSLDFSNAVITPAAGCSATGITLGSSASFDQGNVDSITIAQASNSAETSCYWDITNIGVTQKIPGGQASGNYSINMNLSLVSN